MRALFVTNQRKTAFYDVIARRMGQLGIDVHWISVSNRWTEFLLGQGWARDAILSLADFGEEWSRPYVPTAEDEARAARIEADGETSLKNVLMMDRELNRQRGLDSEAYVHVVTREIERFVRDKGIRVGFGEPTWAPEMLASLVLEANGGRYYMHHTIRVPSERFGFFRGIFHDRLEKITAPTDEHRALARDAIKAVRERGARPYYFAANMNPEKFRPHWIEEARIALARPLANQFDHTVPSLLDRSKRRLSRRFMAASQGRNRLFERAPSGSTRPFVLVPLHVQPESSVDVFGNAMNNQLETIRALTRVLPFGWEIWVKEHAHAIGNRGGDYYERLTRMPGLRLIDPNEDTMALMRRARLVASVAGTACLEAAVLGIPAITFGKIFFSPILLRDGLDPYGLSHADMAALLAEADAWREHPDRDRRIEDFCTWSIAQSVEGVVGGDARENVPNLAANIDRIAAASTRLVRQNSPMMHEAVA